ncbi:MAG: RNA polymerase subunit sigma-24 [Chthoniobacteraceae bacterium]
MSTLRVARTAGTFADACFTGRSEVSKVAMDSRPKNYQPDHHEFPLTRWTLIRKVCGSNDEDGGMEALQQICLNYWFPLYAWARHSHRSEDDAKDLIQSFFEQLLEKNFLKRADPQKGRLRTFLLTCLKRHAGDLADKATAAKRDARKTISLDFEWAEGRYHDIQADTDSADKLYDKRWAQALLQYSLEVLRTEVESEGKTAEYEMLKPFLGFQPDEMVSYKNVAARMGIGEAALKSKVFRLRKRFHQCVRDHAARTLGNDVAVKEELMELMSIV